MTDTLARIMGFVGISSSFALAIASVAAAQFAPFTNEATQRGLSYLMPGLSGEGVTSGQSVGFADLDGDMDMDIVCLGHELNVVGIFENTGGGHFVNRSALSGIPAFENPSSFGAGDYDGDGDLDLVITTWGHGIHLMRNDGGFTFTEVVGAAGFAEYAGTRGVAWGDLDGDGRIDLFVCNYMNAIPGTGQVTNHVWHNNGDGTFTDVAQSLGLADTAYSFVVALFDADLDGDLDIYLSNDRAMFWPYKPNRFLRNDGGVFTDIGNQNGTALTLFSMGVACGDLNGDGLPDLYCTNLASGTPPLFGENPLMLQQPNGSFTLSQRVWGVENRKSSWGCTFFDADNDGDTDLYVVNQLEGNALFLQLPQLPMVNVAVQAGIAGPSGTTAMDYCASVADVDDDGDLDVVQNNCSSNVRLYINHEGELRNWARFFVVGEGRDTHAIGATVRVRTGATWRMRQLINGANGFLCQNDGLLHFGLGSSTMMDEIAVRWPNSGTVRTLTNYPSKQRWKLYPPSHLGDANGDGAVDQSDLSAFAQALAGPFVPGKEVFDFDGNGLLTAADTAAFDSVFGGLRGDYDLDHDVDGVDLMKLLQGWGAANSPADLNWDGIVDGADLGILLGNWS